MSWLRYRFYANEDDWRPVTFPPPGPCWCTGYGSGYAIVIAYLPPEVDLKTAVIGQRRDRKRTHLGAWFALLTDG